MIPAADRPRWEDLGELDVHIWVVRLDDPDKGQRRALAHAAQDQILAAYLGVDPATLRYARLEYGKPVLADGGLQFNLSHSEQLALVAVSRSLPVGVDVQAPHPTLSKPWFAQRVCTARELAEGPGPEQLLRLWVRKEAVIKARGEGSYVSAGAVDVTDGVVADGWLCVDLPLPSQPSYRAAVATRSQPGVSVVVKGLFSPESTRRR